jgi:hypothetical protein
MGAALVALRRSRAPRVTAVARAVEVVVDPIVTVTVLGSFRTIEHHDPPTADQEEEP